MLCSYFQKNEALILTMNYLNSALKAHAEFLDSAASSFATQEFKTIANRKENLFFDCLKNFKSCGLFTDEEQTLLFNIYKVQKDGDLSLMEENKL